MSTNVVNAFNSGVLSPQLDGRTDVEKIFRGCKTLTNNIVQLQGGFERRAGTQYIGPVKTAGDTTRIIPFVFSVGITYFLEFGDSYIRFYRDGAALGAPYEVATPYTDVSRLKFLKYIQSADVMYLVHPDYQPRKLSRNGDTDWTLAITTMEDGPFQDVNLDLDIKMAFSYPIWVTATAYTEGDCVSIRTANANVLDGADAVNKGNGKVGLPATGHGWVEYDLVFFTGTTNYDTFWYEVDKDTTTNEIVIRANYVAETFDGTEDGNLVIVYNALTTHTSGAGNPTPPGNTADWAVATKYTGTNLTIDIIHPTTSPFLFNSNMTGGLFKFTHPLKQSTVQLTSKSADYTSEEISVPRGISWTFVTSGTWQGQVYIERSLDGGATFPRYKTYTSGSVGGNFTDAAEEFDEGAIYRIFYDHTGGIVDATLSIDSFINQGIIQLGTYSSTTSFTNNTVFTALGRLSQTSDWAAGAWNDDSLWPTTNSFHDGRLWYGGNDGLPTVAWSSKSDDFENLSAGTLDDDAIVKRLDGDQINKIQWLVSLSHMVIGTAGGIWTISATNVNDPITPTNVTQRRHDTKGSADVSPGVIGRSILYASRGGKCLMEVLLSSEIDGYVTNNLMRLAGHLTDGATIIEIAIQRNPAHIAWCVLSNGDLIGLTFERDDEVVAWHHHETDGDIESIAIAPDATGEDQIWMVIKRTISSATVRHIERKKDQYFSATSLKEYWGVDSGLNTDLGVAVTITGITQASPAVVTSATHLLSDGNFVRITGVVGMTEVNNNVYLVANKTANTYELQNSDGTATNIDSSGFTAYTSGGAGERVAKTLSNLSHLEGKSVQVLADGAVKGNETVVSGAVTIDDWANYIIIGLPFTSVCQPMRPDIGKKKHISRIALQVHKSVSGKYGKDLLNLYQIFEQHMGMTMDTAIPVEDETIILQNDGGWDKDADIFLVQDLPLPFSATALVYDVEVGSL